MEGDVDLEVDGDEDRWGEIGDGGEGGGREVEMEIEMGVTRLHKVEMKVR